MGVLKPDWSCIITQIGTSAGILCPLCAQVLIWAPYFSLWCCRVSRELPPGELCGIFCEFKLRLIKRATYTVCHGELKFWPFGRAVRCLWWIQGLVLRTSYELYGVFLWVTGLTHRVSYVFWELKVWPTGVFDECEVWSSSGFRLLWSIQRLLVCDHVK